MKTLTVERVWEGKRVTHFRVGRGGAGEMVTVRTSEFGVYCCLSCISIECPHAKAAEAFDRSAGGVERSLSGEAHEKAAEDAA
jgi:hypothetical protein